MRSTVAASSPGPHATVSRAESTAATWSSRRRRPSRRRRSRRRGCRRPRRPRARRRRRRRAACRCPRRRPAAPRRRRRSACRRSGRRPRLHVAGHRVVAVAADHHGVDGGVGVLGAVGAVAAGERVVAGPPVSTSSPAPPSSSSRAPAPAACRRRAAGERVLLRPAGERVRALTAEQLGGRLARRRTRRRRRRPRRVPQQVRKPSASISVTCRPRPGVDVERGHAEAEHAAEVVAHLAVRAGGERRAALAHEHRPAASRSITSTLASPAGVVPAGRRPERRRRWS